MTPEHHLHQETSILPVKPHNDLLCTQFLLSIHEASHPNFCESQTPNPPRQLRVMLKPKYEALISEFLDNGKTDLVNLKTDLAELHR